MKKTLLMVGLVCLLHTSAHAWRAYNDLRWAPDDDGTNNITLYSWTNNVTKGPAYETSGSLVNYETGEDLSATLTVSSTDTGDYDYTNQGANAVANTDADAVFGAAVGSKGNLSNGDITLTFAGLDTNLTYTIAVYGNRDAQTYAGVRYGKFTISNVTSFVNLSSSGTLTTTNVLDNDTTEYCTGYNTSNGYVARFSQIDPGSDGEIIITVQEGAQTSSGQGKYANAVMIETEEETGLILEISQLLWVVFCLLGVARLRPLFAARTPDLRKWYRKVSRWRYDTRDST